jgi:GTPase SAR1 family protein
VDAVILVFSLENEASFQELYQLYSQLHSHRADLPVIVVGTQGQDHTPTPYSQAFIKSCNLNATFWDTITALLTILR